MNKSQYSRIHMSYLPGVELVTWRRVLRVNLITTITLTILKSPAIEFIVTFGEVFKHVFRKNLFCLCQGIDTKELTLSY